MNTTASIIGPIYQKLLFICEKHKISINLDIEKPALKIRQEDFLREFLKQSLNISIKNSKAGDKISINQQITDDSYIRFSVKTDGDIVDGDTKAKLSTQNINVRSRFGYGNTFFIDIH